MAPGPSKPSVFGGQNPSFVFLHLSWPSHQHPTGPHLLPNVTPRQSRSPSLPSFLHLFFSVWTFFLLSQLQRLQLNPTFFSNWVFFLFWTPGNECVCLSLREQRVNCYCSPVIHLVLTGPCQGTSYYFSAAHTTNPYSMYDIWKKVLLQSKWDLCSFGSGCRGLCYILHLPSVHRRGGYKSHNS